MNFMIYNWPQSTHAHFPIATSPLTSCQAIRAREAKAALGQSAPETPHDFDRLLVASPNASFIWIKYMAYYIMVFCALRGI